MLLVLVVVCTLGCTVALVMPLTCWACQGAKGSTTCADPFSNITSGAVLQICAANQHVCYKLHNPDSSYDRGCAADTCPDPREAAKGDSWIKFNSCRTCEGNVCNAAPSRPSPPGALLLAATSLLVAVGLGARAQ
jgi:hypothetical protein